jgi:hypothetical protein
MKNSQTHYIVIFFLSLPIDENYLAAASEFPVAVL